jgi:hypothetical protein
MTTWDARPRTASEGAAHLEVMTNGLDYDGWFRAEVREALDDPGPDVADADAAAEFAARRAASLHKLGEACSLPSRGQK